MERNIRVDCYTIFIARQVHHQLFMRFDKGMEKMRDYINNTKKHIYLFGVLQASKVFIRVLCRFHRLS